MHTLAMFFGWPDGSVWGNLVSNPLWGIPAFAVSHVLARRHRIKSTAAQTEELKAHIDERLGGETR